MHRNTGHALALSLFLSCAGAAVGAEPAPNAGPQGPTPAAAKASLAERAARVLDLRPGDAERIAVAQPLAFRAVPGDREFSGELIVRTRDRAGESSRRAASSRIAPLTTRRSAFVEEFVVRVPEGMTEGELAGVLMATGDYEFAEPNWTLYPLATVPNDPQYNQSWQHQRLQSALAWDLHRGSPDVIVAVCDSGVRTNHEDLAAALVPGYNSASHLAEADGGAVQDINGHGTFVAGCAAAIGNNGRGVTGVGWNLRIMPIRVTNSSGGTAGHFALLEGARWAANHGAKIVNVSFTGANTSSNNAAARDVKLAGGLLFWASGNDGAPFTGILPDLVIVGSTNSSDNRSNFSNYGPGLGVVAPGSSVRSTQMGGGYGNSSGTSFASPIAAGVGAMIFSANPALSPDDVQDVLYRSADDLGAPGFDQYYGHGRVNTYKAVTMAMSYVPRLPLPLTEDFDSASWADVFASLTGAPGLVTDPDAPTGASALELTGSEAAVTAPLTGRGVTTNDAIRLAVRTLGAEPGEALIVEYEGEDGSWSPVFTAPASGADTGYVVHEEPVPLGFRHHGVRLRVRADGSDASDRWLVDALSIGPASAPSAPFAETFDTGRASRVRWIEAPGTSVVLQGTDFVMRMPDGAAAQTVGIPIIDLFAMEQYAYFFVAGDGVGAGDKLTVEWYTPQTGWQTLGVVDGGTVGAAQTGVEFPVPFTAITSNNFRLRFSAQTAGGAFLVDDVNVGTARLPDENLGCSAADLAEPFGTLNFFDLSAFLALFNADDPAADFAEPFGSLNFFDVSAYLSAFNAGCP